MFEGVPIDCLPLDDVGNQNIDKRRQDDARRVIRIHRRRRHNETTKIKLNEQDAYWPSLAVPFLTSLDEIVEQTGNPSRPSWVQASTVSGPSSLKQTAPLSTIANPENEARLATKSAYLDLRWKFAAGTQFYGPIAPFRPLPSANGAHDNSYQTPQQCNRHHGSPRCSGEIRLLHGMSEPWAAENWA